MKIEKHTYVKPEARVLMFCTEQVVCAQSGIGGNEDMTEDPDDYTDFFE